MLNCKETVVSALTKILPTYYELFCDSSVKTPCITYLENNNASQVEGDTLGYSRVSYIIKVWGNDVGEVSNYACLLDREMRELGFNRVSSNEMSVDTLISKILIYEGLGKEKY